MSCFVCGSVGKITWHYYVRTAVNDTPLICLVVFSVTAVFAAISLSLQVTFAEPFIDFAVPPMLIDLEVPQVFVVILEVPSKLVPLMFLGIANLSASLADAACTLSNAYFNL